MLSNEIVMKMSNRFNDEVSPSHKILLANMGNFFRIKSYGWEIWWHSQNYLQILALLKLFFLKLISVLITFLIRILAIGHISFREVSKLYSIYFNGRFSQQVHFFFQNLALSFQISSLKKFKKYIYIYSLFFWESFSPWNWRILLCSFSTFLGKTTWSS